MPDPITTDSVQSTDRHDSVLSTDGKHSKDSMNSTDGMNSPEGMNASEGVHIDALVEQARALFDGLPAPYAAFRRQIEDLTTRLSHGEIRLAVMGQFKRGKSTFINSLLAIDVLPVSVIPVTSIPTIIRYGSQISCTVRFFNKKPDLVRQTLAEIRDVLTQYVSEEHNPKNRLCVSDATIECDNDILKNGTVLIDTPGFGSTYVHNTKTTVDLIKGCDAVLFLLSADPPFTQTEVEFLKELKRYVPRIFFIVNKIDQISAEELATLGPFLKKILVTELGYGPDVTLFHVSARLGRYAEQPPHSDLAIKTAGMRIVKNEIIDFMVREKYFTLSQAVSGKFATALDAAAARCDADCRELEAPLVATKQQHDWLKQHCESVKTKGERELSLIDVEIKALVDFVDSTLERKKQELSAKAGENVRQLIASAIAEGANPLATVKSSFGPLSDEMLNHLFLQVANSVAGPLAKAIDLPVSQFVKTAEEVRRAVPSLTLARSRLRDQNQVRGLAAFAVNVRSGGMSSAFDEVRLPSFGIFRSKASIRQRCENKLLPLVEGILNEQFEQLSIHVKNSIRNVCDDCKENLGHNFRVLYEAMRKSISDLEATASASEAQTHEKIRFLRERREAFLEIKKLLK